MPVGQSIWKMDKIPERLSSAKLKNENELEDMICHDMSILHENWLPIGRQVVTEFGGKIDVMAI